MGKTHTLTIQAKIDRYSAIDFLLETLVGHPGTHGRLPPPLPVRRRVGWLSHLEIDPPVATLAIAADIALGNRPASPTPDAHAVPSKLLPVPEVAIPALRQIGFPEIEAAHGAGPSEVIALDYNTLTDISFGKHLSLIPASYSRPTSPKPDVSALMPD